MAPQNCGQIEVLFQHGSSSPGFITSQEEAAGLCRLNEGLCSCKQPRQLLFATTTQHNPEVGIMALMPRAA
jgi:hypothetical protein